MSGSRRLRWSKQSFAASGGLMGRTTRHLFAIAASWLAVYPEFVARHQLASLPADAEEPHGLRETLRRYVDWEIVTPVDEIKTRGPRTLLKKGLRYLRAARERKLRGGGGILQ